jgi:phosphate transport system substrate-binding protein
VGLRERPAQANELHHVPLPAELVKQIEAYWATDLK